MVVAFAHEPLEPYTPPLYIWQAERILFERLDCNPDSLDADIEPQRCWNYIGPFESTGVARIFINSRSLPVHTVAWLANAPIEDDDLVPRATECGNKWCVRWSHLELVPKRTGRAHPHAVLSLEARRGLYLARYPLTSWVTPPTVDELAHRYGISRSRVVVILREEARRIERATRRRNR